MMAEKVFQLPKKKKKKKKKHVQEFFIRIENELIMGKKNNVNKYQNFLFLIVF